MYTYPAEFCPPDKAYDAAKHSCYPNFYQQIRFQNLNLAKIKKFLYYRILEAVQFV